jgi:molybdopterin synthase sulfur carrier subunit
MGSEVKVPIQFFGQLAEQFGRLREVEIPSEGCTVADLRARLISASDHLAFALNRPGIRAAVDQEVVGDEALVRPNQEIAFFSPVSGG